MIHINRFIDRIKSLESRKAKDFVMSMQDAKDLHGDITKLLLALQEIQMRQQKAAKPQDTTIELDGGSFK